jgi:hypothetical protein
LYKSFMQGAIARYTRLRRIVGSRVYYAIYSLKVLVLWNIFNYVC